MAASSAPSEPRPARAAPPLLAQLAATRLFGRSPVGAYLRINESLWTRLPPSMTRRRLLSAYGRWLHALARHGDRRQYFGTFFLRNRPELELMRRVVEVVA